VRPLRECIIIGGQAQGGNVLGKQRDRNYAPKLRIVRELINGLEVVYLHDLYTDYLEGMNEKGIGIINAALLVSDDEKAARSFMDRQKKKGNSNDGPRIKRALGMPKLNQCIKSIVGYDTGLKGHTFVGSPSSMYSVEMTSMHNPVVNKLDPTTGMDVRTNHGEEHSGAGYSADTQPDDYLSSKIRKATAQVAIANLDSHEDMMPALTKQTFDSSSNMNMRRTTDKMRSSSQIMMHLDKLEFIFYAIPGECNYVGMIDKTPDNHEPVITVRVLEYNE
jgi:hypothetical protein